MGRVDILAANLAISLSSVVDVRRQEEARPGGVELFIPVLGDVQNSRIPMWEHLDVVGALQLRSIYMGYVILMKT